MIALLIVLASIAAYFLAGAGTARLAVPNRIRAFYVKLARDGGEYRSVDYGYGSIHKFETYDEQKIRERSLERGVAWRVFSHLLWPVALPVFLLSVGLRPTERFSPWFKEDQLKAREAEVKRLEKELGL